MSKITVLLINAVAVYLAVLIGREHWRQNIGKIYIAMTFFMLAWVDFAYLPRYFIVGNEDLSLLLLRIAWVATPMFFYCLFILAAEIACNRKQCAKLSYSVLVISIVLSYLAGWTDKIIIGSRVVDNIFTIIYGDWMMLFLGGISLIIVATIIPIIQNKAWKNKANRHFLAGLIIFYIANAIFNIGLPIFGGISRFYFFGDYSTIILLSLIAYGVLRRNLFNIKVLTVEAVLFVIWLIIGLDIFSTDNLERQVFISLSLVLIVFLGIALIRNMKREIAQKERLQKVSNELATSNARLERLNNKLVQLDKAKSTFLSIASHQLRTPLTALKGFSSMILEGDYGRINNETRGAVTMILASSNRLVDVVENFLDISRLDLGKMHYKFDEVDLKNTVDVVVQELKIKAEQKSLILKYETIKSPTIIKADSVKIRQVVINLIDNAIKYTDAGQVIVVLKITGKTVRFCVKDTGMGMSQDDLRGLFKKFHRTKKAFASYTEGTGLGLYLAKRVIQAHKGKIWAESNGDGKGSKFCFEVPLVKG